MTDWNAIRRALEAEAAAMERLPVSQAERDGEALAVAKAHAERAGLQLELMWAAGANGWHWEVRFIAAQPPFTASMFGPTIEAAVDAAMGDETEKMRLAPAAALAVYRDSARAERARADRAAALLVEAREQLELADEYIEAMPPDERTRLRDLIARLQAEK